LYGPLVSEDGAVSVGGVVRLLAEPARLRVFSALVLGAGTPAEVVAATGLEMREVVVGLRRLTDGGLVDVVDGRAVPVARLFAELARGTAVIEEPEDLGYSDERVAGVLRTFVRDGRLLGLPAQRQRRTIVLGHVAQSFEPGIDYQESEVNAVLKEWAGSSGVDHVSLRRYLIDEDLLHREDGVYRRSGGWTDVSA
jgi:hypothetical protein